MTIPLRQIDTVLKENTNASEVYAVVVCSSVHLSVTSRYCSEMTGRIQLAFGMEASCHLSHIQYVCVVSKFRCHQK